MSRAFLIVLDSAGIGGAPDADRFFNGKIPDTGANTIAHIAQACAKGEAEDARSGPLRMPNLGRLGLAAAVRTASGEDAPGLPDEAEGIFGAATEVSPGKDTPSGHWELAGVPVPWDWHYHHKRASKKTSDESSSPRSSSCHQPGDSGLYIRHSSGS